jgi:hypothetical protein
MLYLVYKGQLNKNILDKVYSASFSAAPQRVPAGN